MLLAPPRAVSSRWWVAAGLITVPLVVIGFVLVHDVVLVGALIVGPFGAAIGAEARQVAALGVLAVALAIVLGAVDGMFGERDHILRTLVVFAGCIAATFLARVREQREQEIARNASATRSAQGLALALAAGEMGTWYWDVPSDRVHWDARLEALYGLDPGSFDGTFDTYTSLLHPTDRERVLDAVGTGMRTGTPWRFDHRILWRDGSVHWLEGRGEPVRAPDGAIVGATGVSIDIDARHHAESERARLLDNERAARRQAERAAQLLERLSELPLALAAAATVDEVAVTIVHHGLVALDGDYGWFGSVDSANGMLVTRAHEGYPPDVIDQFRSVSLDETLPATDALRSGRPVFIESSEDRQRRYPQYEGMEVHGSFVVVPVAAFEDAPGVLAFGFLEPRPFTDDDRRYVSAVVEACTQALRRASLLEAEQR